jgi:hypothetical protein
MKKFVRACALSDRRANLVFLACIAAATFTFPPAHAQQIYTSQTQTSAQQDASPTHAVDLDQAPRVPGVVTLFRGFNAGVTYSGVHNSSIGWYNVATPAISYTFSPHYSADASASIYLHRYVQNTNPTTAISGPLVVDASDAGDTYMSFHATFHPQLLRSTSPASITAPSGNQSAGLGTGRVTYDFDEHMEKYFGVTGLLVDLGAGDSSGLANNYVTKNYTSLGALAHFQTGFVFWLPGRNYIESIAYEQLPIGSQTDFTTLKVPGSSSVSVASGSGLTEDNGFTTAVGIPLTDRITFSSYYNRSLRQHQDTVSVGITFVLHGTPRKRGSSILDRALMEGERDVAPIAYPATTH